MGVEHQVLGRVAEIAATRGLGQVEVPFVATSRNTPAARFLDSLSAAMRHLLDPEGHEAAMLPALAYAEAMRESQMMLMPVPRAVIDEIAGRPLSERLH